MKRKIFVCLFLLVNSTSIFAQSDTLSKAFMDFVSVKMCDCIAKNKKSLNATNISEVMQKCFVNFFTEEEHFLTENFASDAHFFEENLANPDVIKKFGVKLGLKLASMLFTNDDKYF